MVSPANGARVDRDGLSARDFSRRPALTYLRYTSALTNEYPPELDVSHMKKSRA